MEAYNKNFLKDAEVSRPIINVSDLMRHRALQLGEGRGYARLLDDDAERDALLLERLGGQLAEAGIAIGQQLEIICATLKLAWRKIAGNQHLLTGADKARTQSDYIRLQWEQLDRPCA